MRRKLLSLAAAVSLALFVFTGAMWARSYWRGDNLHLQWPEKRLLNCFVCSSRGELLVGFLRWPTPRTLENDFFSGKRWEIISEPPFSYPLEHKLQISTNTCFGYLDWPAWGVGRQRVIGFPYAMPFILWGILPAMCCAKFYRSRRRKSLGLCGACGYDLRATPDRCPECGTQAAAASAR